MVDACWRVFRGLSYPRFWGLSSSMSWESLYRLTNKYHGITQAFQGCSHLLFLAFPQHLKLVLAGWVMFYAYWLGHVGTQFCGFGGHSPIPPIIMDPGPTDPGIL